MLRLLLDEHISPKIAAQLKKKQPQMNVYCVATWRQGLLLSAADDTLLEAAHADALTLVTYDLSSIPPILKGWAEQGVSHGGVILVDQRTLPPYNFGGLVEALIYLWTTQRDRDWTETVFFLQQLKGNK